MSAIVTSVDDMSAEPVERPEDRFPGPESSPAEIRTFLRPDDRPAFDAQWLDVMGSATRSQDLAPVRAMVEHWRRYAIHRALMGEAEWSSMTQRARERFAQPPDLSESLTWDDLLARRAANGR